MSTVLYEAIKVQAKITDSVIVAFSGGKESVVVLDLCFRHFKHVYPFFMYICPGLSFQERTLAWYEKHYGTEIMRLPHMDVCEFFHYGSYRPGDPTFPIVSINDVYDYMRQETGCFWIAAGERMDDSLIRRGMIHKSGSVDGKRGRFYPVSMWKKAEIMDYIKFHKLYKDEYFRRVEYSFSSLAAPQLAVVKKYYPEDYAKLLHLYPFAEAGVLRFEKFGKGKARVMGTGEKNGEV